MLSNLFTGGKSYGTAMRANRMGKFGMSRAMGMKGVGLGAITGLAGAGIAGYADTFEEGSDANVGYGTLGGAMEGAGTGAAIGSFIPGVGTLAGAGIGAAIGGLVAYLNRKDKEEEKTKETSNEKYDQMIKLLQAQSEKDTRIFMDSNQVGIGLALGNPRLN
jgi:phage tail tape-measure protein